METRSYVGGWFQRSGIDLQQFYRYLAFNDVERNTGVSQKKLEDYRRFLGLQNISIVKSYLDYLHAETTDKIEFKYFEDGLYTISKAGDDYQGNLEALADFEKDVLVPALEYFFSRGAPIPKVKDHDNNFERNIVIFPPGPCREIHELITMESTFEGVEMVRTDFIIFLHPQTHVELSTLVEMQIFFAEFSSYLQEHTHQHNHIWETITNLRQQHSIRPTHARMISTVLAKHKANVELNQARLRQMASSLQLRHIAAADTEVQQTLRTLFSVKVESLKNSLNHIQEKWKMTNSYIKNVESTVENILQQYNETVLKTIRVVTSLFGVNLLFVLASTQTFPLISSTGLIYVAFLIGFVLVLEIGVRIFVNMRKYQLKIKNHDLFDTINEN